MNVGAVSTLHDAALTAERRYLMTYATFRLRDTDLANDAVQDTLVAAMQAKAQFAGRSSLRTRLVSILRNKIYDLLAARRGEVYAETMEAEGDDAGTSDGMFDAQGRWEPVAAPQAWGSPEATMEKKEFWEIFQQCLKRMPTRCRRYLYCAKSCLGATKLKLNSARTFHGVLCSYRVVFRGQDLAKFLGPWDGPHMGHQWAMVENLTNSERLVAIDAPTFAVAQSRFPLPARVITYGFIG